jgi:hypothetical protein
MKRIVFFMVFVIWLVVGGCSNKSVPLSISCDSTRVETVHKTDSLWFVDPEWLQLLYKCDSNFCIVQKEKGIVEAKFDSLAKISPMVKHHETTRVSIVEHKQYMSGAVKVVYEKKYVNTVTVVMFVVSFILLFCLILTYILFYRYTKSNGT